MTAMPNDTRLLNLDPTTLGPSPLNPRKHYDDDRLQDLADSIRDVGLLQPLVVRVALVGPTPYELVCGHRRARAAQIAGLAEVPCRVVDMTDAQALEAMLVENSQRRDVPILDEADALSRLVDLGRDPGEVIDRMGRSAKWGRDRLALRELDEHYRTLLAEGAIALKSAVAIAKLPAHRQAQLRQRIRAPYRGALSHEQVVGIIQGRDLDSAPWDLDDDTIGPKRSPSCSACPMRSDRQQDLWEAPNQSSPRCLDTDCYEQRREAHVARLEADGATIERGYPDHRALRAVSPIWQAHTVDDRFDADEPPTWGDLLGERVKPTLYVTDYDIEAAYPPEQAYAALREAGHEKLADHLEQPSGTSAASAEPERPKVDPAELGAATKALFDRLEGQAIGWFPMACDAADEAAAVVRELARAAFASSVPASQRSVARALGLKVDDLLASFADADAPTGFGLLCRLLLERYRAEAASKWSTGLSPEAPLVRLLDLFKVERPEHLVRGDS